jgi:hypothetical protein
VPTCDDCVSSRSSCGFATKFRSAFFMLQCSARKNRNFMERTKRSYVWPLKAEEYRHLADSTRRPGYVEQSAQWEILAWEISAATYRVDAAAELFAHRRSGPRWV